LAGTCRPLGLAGTLIIAGRSSLVKTLTLREALANSTLSDLRAIAGLLGIPNAGAAAKGELMERLMTPLGSADALKAAVRKLSPDEWLALDALVREGGAVLMTSFQAYFGEIRRAKPEPADDAPRAEPGSARPKSRQPGVAESVSSPQSHPPLPSPFQQSLTGTPVRPSSADAGPARPEYWQHPISPLESLWYKGLLFSSEIGFGRSYFLPSDVLAVLAPLLGATRPAVSLDPLPYRFPTAPSPDILGDLLQFLILIKKESIKPVQGWRLPKRALVALNSRLSVSQENIANAQDETEAPYIRILHRILTELRLVTNSGVTLAPAVGTIHWLERGRSERTRELWEFLGDRVVLDETSAIPVSSFVDLEPAVRRRNGSPSLRCPRRCATNTQSFCAAGAGGTRGFFETPKAVCSRLGIVGRRWKESSFVRWSPRR
jgi:hypothetical protein